MGSLIIFCLILYALYKDAQTLQKEDPKLYLLQMGLKPWLWAAISVLFYLISLPVYYFLRRQFFKALAERRFQAGSSEYVNPKFPLITECTELALLWFFLMNCSILLYEAFALLFAKESVLLEFSFLGLFSNIIVLLLIVSTVRRNHRQTFFSFVRFCVTKNFFLRAILLPFGLGVVLAGLSYVIGEVYNISPPTPLGNALEDAGNFSFLFFMFCVMFIAPFLEEVIYRGYLFSIISEIKGKIFALIFIAVLFAVFHVDQIWGSWLGLAIIFAMGFSVTLLRLWSHSVIPSIVAHYAYNISLVMMPLLIVYFTPLGEPPGAATAYLKPTGQENTLSQSWERARGFDSLKKGVLNKGYHFCIIVRNGSGQAG